MLLQVGIDEGEYGYENEICDILYPLEESGELSPNHWVILGDLEFIIWEQFYREIRDKLPKHTIKNFKNDGAYVWYGVTKKDKKWIKEFYNEK